MQMFQAGQSIFTRRMWTDHYVDTNKNDLPCNNTKIVYKSNILLQHTKKPTITNKPNQKENWNTESGLVFNLYKHLSRFLYVIDLWKTHI